MFCPTYCKCRAKIWKKPKPGFARKGEAGQVQGAPCRGSKGEQPFAGRDQSEDLRAHKEARRGGEKGSAKSPVLQSCTRLVAESDLCGKQPPGVERRESHRTKKEAFIVLPAAKEVTAAI